MIGDGFGEEDNFRSQIAGAVFVVTTRILQFSIFFIKIAIIFNFVAIHFHLARVNEIRLRVVVERAGVTIDRTIEFGDAIIRAAAFLM